MVGDIKQSIYGFRSARPEIFAGMKKAFPGIDEAKGDEASIFMSLNFRCDRGVVDFVNDIFDKAFGFVAESIGYAEGDRLGYAKKQPYGEPEYRYPTLCMVDKVSSDEDKREPIVVAAKIAELLESGTLNDGSPIRPSDIAIILRNAKDKDVKYASALADIGIPCAISGAKDFFLSPEVLLALCLLNSLDNPRRDIYLGGLMCSPLFNFTADELYLIRSTNGETLYESLVNYVKCNEWFTKGADFLKKLAFYREISEGVGVDLLIHKLYRETGLMALASRTGGRDNLTLLYDYARSYEAGSFKGLYNFISFINEIIDGGKTFFDESRAETGVDAVKIVTSHGSKGLEYPVVFLVGSGSRISNKEARNRMAFNEDFGIAFRLRTPSGLALAQNPVRDIINLYIEKKLYEEELRVLYVALTRARERLFMTGTCSTVKRDEYESRLDSIRDNLSEYSFRELGSYMEIASVCLGKNPVSEDEFVRNLPDMAEDVIEHEEAQNVCEADEGLRDELAARFSFEYSRKHMTTLPEKMSVSLMSPTILDGTDGESVFIGSVDYEPEILPAFASGGGAEESAKRGIATHLFMQFMSLENLKKEGASAELDRLHLAGFISAEDKERVRLPEIEMFRKSELFSRMLDAKKIYRELRFNVLLPATEFTEDEEKISAYRDKEILVQGVIDCIIEGQDGSLTLCDYKTDRLTREELSDRPLAEERLKNKHSMQLGLYSMAIEKIFGKKPSVVEIYSLALGDTVRII
jgi:ATP-dependent helicase/nuclease subunit A